MNTCIHVDLGQMEYKQCLDLQRKVHHLREQDLLPDCLLFVEHSPVFTLGTNAKRDNLLVSSAVLEANNVDCVPIERGGDITFHGPGQMVIYPIFKIHRGGFSVSDFISNLEEVMILILAKWGIEGRRSPKNRGVWIDQSKIGFVGVAIKRRVTLHGLALNISPDLNYFAMINPCGMAGVNITSLQQLTSETIAPHDVVNLAESFMSELFNYRYTKMNSTSFQAHLAQCTARESNEAA